jgi:hypothetical protein
LIVGLWAHFLKGMAFGALLLIPAILVLIFVLWISAWLSDNGTFIGTSSLNFMPPRPVSPLFGGDIAKDA